MKNLLDESNKILIILPELLTFDTATAALGLAQLLPPEKEITFGISKPIPKEFLKVLDFSSFEIKERLQKREVVLSINKKRGEVNSVRWREVNGKIQFIISPEEGNFEFDDVDLQTTGEDFDLVVVLGCRQLKDAGSVCLSSMGQFRDVNILNIDVHQNNGKFGTVNKIGGRTSLSNWMLELIESQGYNLTKEVAETLFKGIFWSTEGFKIKRTIKRTLGQLSPKGYDMTDSVAQMFQTLTVAELRYIGKIITNMQVNTEGVIRSKVRFNEVQDVRIDRILYPEVNIISRVKDFKVAAIFSEYKSQKVLVRVYGNTEDVNIFNALAQFSPVGNQRRVEFKVSGSIDDVEKRVMKQITVGLKIPQKVNSSSEKQKKVRPSLGPLPQAEDLPEVKRVKVEQVHPLRTPPVQPITQAPPPQHPQVVPIDPLPRAQ